MQKNKNKITQKQQQKKTQHNKKKSYPKIDKYLKKGKIAHFAHAKTRQNGQFGIKYQS